jgi:hypothetical protein
MTPVNGKFKVLGFSAAGASVAIPTGTTHFILAGSKSATHLHAKIDGVEFVVQAGLPIGITGTTLSNSALSGGASGEWTHATFLRV